MTSPPNSASAYHSGDFSLDIERPGSNAVAIFGNHVCLIGHGDDSNLHMTTFELGQNFTRNVADKASWKSSQVNPSNVPHGMSAWRHCGADASLGANPGLYLFWVNQNHGWVLATRCESVGGDTPAWSQAITLLHPDGVRQIVTTGDIGATAFGQDGFLVAVLFENSPGQSAIALFAFNTNDIDDPTSTWAARSYLYMPQSVLTEQLQTVWPTKNIQQIGPNITVAWSSGVPDAAPPPPSSSKPVFYATLFIKAAVEGEQDMVSLPLVVFLDENGKSGEYYLLAPIEALPTVHAPETFGNIASALQVVRDPAGRLLAFYTDHVYSLNRQPALGYLSNLVYPTSSVPSVNQKPMIGVSTRAPINSLPPAVCYFIDLTAQSGDICPQGSTATPTFPVYQFAFFGKSVKCKVDYFGYIEVLCNAYQSSLQPETIMTLDGLIEGPVPLPNPNIIGTQFPAGETNLGTITYGDTTSDETKQTREMDWSIGMEASGNTTKGFGPAFDTSFSSGCGSVTSKTKSADQMTAKTQDSEIEKDANDVGTGVLARGTFFAAPQNFIGTLYRFYDVSGNIVSDASSNATGQAAKFAVISVVPPTLEAYSYTPFLVNPGDLASYTVEAINARMNALLPHLKTPDLISKRSPPWGKYFEDVIVANAYKFSNGQKYLSFSWTVDGGITNDSKTTDTTFVENSWTMNAKVYTGVSGGEDFEVFGMGYGGQFENFLPALKCRRALKRTPLTHHRGRSLSTGGTRRTVTTTTLTRLYRILSICTFCRRQRMPFSARTTGQLSCMICCRTLRDNRSFLNRSPTSIHIRARGRSSASSHPT